MSKLTKERGGQLLPSPPPGWCLVYHSPGPSLSPGWCLVYRSPGPSPPPGWCPVYRSPGPSPPPGCLFSVYRLAWLAFLSIMVKLVHK